MDSYFTVRQQFDDAIDELEDETLTDPTPMTLQRVFLIKRQSIHLRRIIGSQRRRWF